ncbi:hypothetical protein LEP1GSC050_0637 [Leptospira broomii serovar Hurstbridge str. 5399]|uniref:Uncharacterized protein n=1 Tax=Leptospira broomii serovar Hurstbridge str. 5399 TaxID=1049789 RepID=T0F6J9_9LEPT|nr:hypothetical protein LEP1GSC050_0637 [Leptospira broomii serovar Hurstbridge str. 5399]
MFSAEESAKKIVFNISNCQFTGLRIENLPENSAFERKK